MLSLVTFTTLLLGSSTFVAGGVISRGDDLGLEKRSCSTKDITHLKGDFPHAAKFCDWYLSAPRTTSPATNLSYKEFVSACECITGEKATTKAVKSTKKATGVVCSASAKKLLAHDVTHPTEFCKFWDADLTRTTSPFADISKAKSVFDACACYIPAKAKTTTHKHTTTKKHSTTKKHTTTTHKHTTTKHTTAKHTTVKHTTTKHTTTKPHTTTKAHTTTKSHTTTMHSSSPSSSSTTSTYGLPVSVVLPSSSPTTTHKSTSSSTTTATTTTSSSQAATATCDSSKPSLISTGGNEYAVSCTVGFNPDVLLSTSSAPDLDTCAAACDTAATCEAAVYDAASTTADNCQLYSSSSTSDQNALLPAGSTSIAKMIPSTIVGSGLTGVLSTLDGQLLQSDPNTDGSPVTLSVLSPPDYTPQTFTYNPLTGDMTDGDNALGFDNTASGDYATAMTCTTSNLGCTPMTCTTDADKTLSCAGTTTEGTTLTGLGLIPSGTDTGLLGNLGVSSQGLALGSDTNANLAPVTLSLGSI